MNRILLFLCFTTLCIGVPHASAGTGPELLAASFDDSSSFQVQSDAYFFSESRTDIPKHGLTLSLFQSDARWQILPGNKGSPVLGHNLFYLNLETNDPRLPKRLWDQSIGIGQPLAEIGEWQLGLTAAVGYNGIDPYSSANSLYGKGSFIANWRLSPHDGLVGYLVYDPTSTLFPDFPYPNIAYYNTADPKLHYIVGLPYSSAEWKPLPGLTIDAHYQLVTTFDLEAQYHVLKSLQIFAGLHDIEYAFRMPTGINRYFFSQRRLEAGLDWTPTQWADLRLSGGYAFNTEFRTGFDDRNTHSLTHASDSPFIHISFALDF